MRKMGKKILPDSFIGGSRHMHRLCQDRVAIIHHCGKPDLFITMTCNPKWPEITENLLPGQQAQDRPDLVSRVFKLKFDKLRHELEKKQLFGGVKAWIHTIEFQKRGLPHAHILITLDDKDKPRTTEDYDTIVSAEIPDPETHPLAYETVVQHMMHGPCGTMNSKASSMKEGKCSKITRKPS